MKYQDPQLQPHSVLSRRTFVAGALAVSGALSAAGLRAAEPAPPQPAGKPVAPAITRKVKGRLTMDELLKENKKLEFDFAGFKA
jgi:hypothetical protein